MRSRFGHFLARFSVLVLVAGMVAGMVAGVLTAGAAEAQMRSLRELMFGKHADDGRDNNHMPVVAHFKSARGEGFTLDDTQAGAPLLRFDGDDEVFQLTAKPGANGDITYRDDIGEPVLKATRLGGMILFSGAHADVGDPAAVTGQAGAFTPDRLNPAELVLHMAKSSLRVSRACNHQVLFSGDFEDPHDDIISLFAETASVTSDALVQIASQSETRHTVDRLHEVYMMIGRPPGAHMEKDVLVIKLDPSRGTWGGHPSSKRIMNVVMMGSDAEIRR